MKKLILPVFCLSLLLVAACVKEKESIKPGTQTSTSQPTHTEELTIGKVFDEQKLQYKTVTIDAGETSSFYGESGTRYLIRANSFLTPDGNLAIGKVDVHVAEYLNKGDMIFSKMLPISNGKILASGGELAIEATQNGEQLRLKPNSSFRAFVPQQGKPDREMSVFRGASTLDDQSLVDWEPVVPIIDTNGNNTNLNVGIIFGNDTTQLFGDSLGWWNIDRFYGDEFLLKTFSVQVKPTDVSLPSPAVIYAYVLPVGFRGAWPLASPISNHVNGFYNPVKAPGIPLHFIAFTIINVEFYGGVLAATPTDGKQYIINISKIDPTDLKKQLNSL